MKKKNTVSYELDPEHLPPLTAAQRAELGTLATMSEEQIDTSDVPLLSQAFWKTAVNNPFYRPIKQQLTVRLDADVLTWLRSAGRGYQTKLNAILREAMVQEVTIQARPDSRTSQDFQVRPSVPPSVKRPLRPRPEFAKAPAVSKGIPSAFSSAFSFAVRTPS